MKPKKGILLISTLILILGIILLSVYMAQRENIKNLKALLPETDMIRYKLRGYLVDQYNEISSVVFQNQKLKGRETVQEYIVVNSPSLAGTEHVDIKNFSDGTGEMIHKLYCRGSFDLEEFVVDETFALDREQAAQVVKVFEDNNFWEIPSEHPEEQFGLDGYTLFVEGIKVDQIEGVQENQYNIISMWCPDDKYEIKKIYNDIMAFVGSWEPMRRR